MFCLGQERGTEPEVFSKGGICSAARAASENHSRESAVWRRDGQCQLSHGLVAMGTRVHKRFLSRLELEFEWGLILIT